MAKHLTIKVGAFSTVSLLAMMVGAQAQTAAQTNSGTESVIVTGSRVISDVQNSPTPITEVSSDQLLATTPTDLPNALNKLPVFFGSASVQAVVGATANGVADSLNLRDIGAQRTLILFDGHRLAPSAAAGTVDIDNLPEMLIDRVDVVTGGASAVYGSDAVSGVVNFVLNKKFDGIKFNGNAGTSYLGLGTERQFGVAAGTDLLDGRLHIEGSARYFLQDQVHDKDMPYGQGGQSFVATGSGTAAIPYGQTQYARFTAQPWAGLVTCTGCSANNQSFVSTGVIGAYNAGTPTATSSLSNGGGGGYDWQAAEQASLRKDEGFVRMSYDIAPGIEFYAQGLATETRSIEDGPQNGIISTTPRPNTFYTTNAFLPAAAQTALQAGNTTNTFALANLFGQPGTSPDVEYLSNVKAIFVDRKLTGTAGFDGTFLDKFTWDVYYTHDENREDGYDPNNVNYQLQYAAEDAVIGSGGTPVCYVSTTANAGLYPGCVPLNPFGANATTADMLRYFTQRTGYVMTNTMDDLGATISGEIFDLPAGPVKAALSGEGRWLNYVVNSSTTANATVNCTGLRLCNAASPLYEQSTSASAAASENVYEFAGELNIPLLAGLPLVQSLSVDLAGRYTNYSPSGSVLPWKVGVDYHVNDSVRFRGTASVDIRAPTLNDLYAPTSTTSTSITDIITNTSGRTLVQAKGNPDLTPEVAHTYTAGVVLTPDFVPGLTTSIDYFRIDLSQAITSLSFATLAVQQLCQQFGPTSQYCQLAIRPLGATNTTAANFPTSILSAGVNAATIKTEGVDFETDYDFDIADVISSWAGSVSARALMSYQPHLTTVTIPGAAPTLTAMPKVRFTAFLGYRVGDWGINLQDRWLSGYRQATTYASVYAIEPRVHSWNTVDLTVDRRVKVDADSVLDFYVGAQNLFNEASPLVAGPQVTTGLYYPVGRVNGSALGTYFTVGVKADL